MNFHPATWFAPEYLPYVLPGLIVLATGLVVFLLIPKKKADASRLKPPRMKKKGSAARLFDKGSTPNDRRAALRRDGTPVEVVVTSPAFTAGKNQGYVLDRSTGGMRLALAAGMAPGSSLQVRAKNAPDASPWVTVVVRSCKNAGEHFELGCEFEQTPPWNVLLLFG